MSGGGSRSRPLRPASSLTPVRPGGALRARGVARHRGRGPARSPSAAARTGRPVKGAGGHGRAASLRAGGLPAHRGPLYCSRCGPPSAGASPPAGAATRGRPRRDARGFARVRSSPLRCSGSRPCGSRPPGAPVLRLQCHRRPPARAPCGGCGSPSETPSSRRCAVLARSLPRRVMLLPCGSRSVHGAGNVAGGVVWGEAT